MPHLRRSFGTFKIKRVGRLVSAMLIVPALICLTAVASLSAQSGVIAGKVVDARSLEPLDGAQVVVEGTQQRAVSDASGEFRITGLPSGGLTLRVMRLGYRTTTISVEAGQTDLQITLEPQAVMLDEMVVTGTAGGQAKRALGNAVVTLDAEAINEVAPALTVGNLLNARAPGVVLQKAQGVAGGGARINIRGRSSMAFVGNPLIYVDGVRVNNEFFSGPDTPEANAPRSLSRLNDIDPDDIESIEIIKGPAAATLYGTEATSGVVQIITKKGHSGEPQFQLVTRQGVNHLQDVRGVVGERWGRNPETGEVFSFSPLDVLRNERGAELFRDGHIQGYGLSVRGGSESAQYYVSGNFDRENGIVPSNMDERIRTRANLSFQPHSTLSVNTGLSLADTETSTFHYLYFYSARFALPQLLDTPADGFLGPPPDVQNATQDLRQTVNHVTTNVQVEHDPTEWFTHRMILGFDRTDTEDTWLVPFIADDDLAQHFSANERLGFKNIAGDETVITTVDYSGTVSAQPTESLASNSSVGFQLYSETNNTETLSGENFPAPGVESLAGITGQRDASERVLENTTVGLYVQQQFSWKDRLYLTAAIRGDDNSAFGSGYDVVTYPKVSMSWVASEEPFWAFDWANEFRLRAAYGEAGQQPDAFAAIRTFQPIPGWNNMPAGSPQFSGNPDLGPERAKELELGFDAGLFNGRLALDFTWYWQKTLDAIVSREVAPSSGFPGSQFVNAGSIRNRGVELLVNARPLETRAVDLDLTFNFSTNDNEVLSIDVPGVDAIPVGFIPNLHKAGYPVASYFGRRVVSAELSPEGEAINVLCDDGDGGTTPCSQAPDVFIGQNMPDTEGSLQATLTLFDRLGLNGLVDFKLGRDYLGANMLIDCLFLGTHEVNFHPQKFDPEDVAFCQGAGLRFWDSPAILDGDFAKLRELSLNYVVPEGLLAVAPINASRATITLAARNIHTWFDRGPFQGPDPEVFTNVNHGSSNHDQAVIPLPLQVIGTVRLTF